SKTLKTGAGADTFNIANNANNLNFIHGWTANAGTGNNALNVSDAGFGGNDTYTVTTSQVSLPNSLGLIVTYSGMKSLKLSTGAGADVLNVESTLASTPVTLNAGNGNNTFNVSPASKFLDNIQGAVNINAGSGNNTLTTFDQNDGFTGDAYQIAIGSVQ